MIEKIKSLWIKLYGENNKHKLNELINILDNKKNKHTPLIKDKNWYKKAVIYSLYVDAFENDFSKLSKYLTYIKNIGADTLWLLPILESPKKDEGFDVSDYKKISSKLGGNKAFSEFIKKAHDMDIKIIFDVAVNHSSESHKWFREARKSKDSPYRNYYIWSRNGDKYTQYEEWNKAKQKYETKQVRVLLKGTEYNNKKLDSNWTYDEISKEFYFHRFFPFQPDLNYHTPDVLIEMIDVLLYWKESGVDGFRIDAAPFLWKEDGTNCENLDNTHTVIKMFRSCLDYVEEGTVLLAEANITPDEVKEFFGDGDECQMAYHFPLMPNFYLAIAENNPDYLIKTKFPKIPEDCRWIIFLRCHDELTLEFTPQPDKELMREYYLKDKRMSFREGDGIAGRLYNLLEKDYRKVLLAYSLMFSMEGTPINYYGDEIAMTNNEDYHDIMFEKTGNNDPRFYNRGGFNFDKLRKAENDPDSDAYKILHGLKEMTTMKNKYSEFFINGNIKYYAENSVFISERTLDEHKLLIYNNISDNTVNIEGKEIKAFSYKWQIVK